MVAGALPAWRGVKGQLCSGACQADPSVPKGNIPKRYVPMGKYFGPNFEEVFLLLLPVLLLSKGRCPTKDQPL